MHHLGGKAQQPGRYLQTKAARQLLAEQVFQGQPEPGDQHQNGDDLGELGLALDQEKTRQAGDKAIQRHDPGKTLQQGVQAEQLGF